MSEVRALASGNPAAAALLAALQSVCFAEAWGEEAIRALLAPPNVTALVAAEAGGSDLSFAQGQDVHRLRRVSGICNKADDRVTFLGH